MVGPNTTKLKTLPWPLLAGVSLLIHGSALGVGLPLILKVGSPTSSTANIPVTLVDDGAPPVPVSSALPQTPQPSEPVPQSTLIGGQNTSDIPKVVQNSQPVASSTPEQRISSESLNSADIRSTPSPTATERDPVSETPRESPSENSSGKQTPASEGPQSDNETTDGSNGEDTGSVKISVLGDAVLPDEARGDRPDNLPVFLSASVISVPRNHTCGETVSAAQITLGIIIDPNGAVVQAFPPATSNSESVQVASCLLTAAVQANPNAIRFTPATSNNGDAVATDRVELTVEFAQVNNP